MTRAVRILLDGLPEGVQRVADELDAALPDRMVWHEEATQGVGYNVWLEGRSFPPPLASTMIGAPEVQAAVADLELLVFPEQRYGSSIPTGSRTWANREIAARTVELVNQAIARCREIDAEIVATTRSMAHTHELVMRADQQLFIATSLDCRAG